MVSIDLIKVVALFLIWATMGLYLEIPGPTMIDIKLLFKASYEDVSRSVSGRGAGGFTGGIIGGILVDKFPHSLDLIIGVSESMAAIAVLSIPFSPSINTLWFHYFILGMCSGLINIAGIRAVITAWGDKTAMTLQLLHVGYGVGALLVPVIVNPFLADIKYPTVATDDGADFTVINDTRVHLAFVGIGLIALCLACVFFYFHWCMNNQAGYKRVQTGDSKKALTFKEMINPATYANGQFGYGVSVLIILFIYYYNMVGGEEMFGHFIRSFSVDVFKFSKTQASYLNTTFWLGLTIGRVCWAVLSGYIPIGKLFLVQVVVHAFTTTALNIYAASSPSMLWLCTFSEGFMMSPLYPCGIAYGNTLIEITGVCLTVIQFAGSVGDLSFIWVAGKLYDAFGPRSVLYALQVVGILLMTCVLFLRIGERYKRVKIVDVTI